MKKILKFLAAAVLAPVAFLVAPAATTHANIGPASYTDCDQSASFGSRVCVEKNGPYGYMWVIGYSNATTISFAGIASVVTSPYSTSGAVPCTYTLPIASMWANRITSSNPSSPGYHGLRTVTSSWSLPATQQQLDVHVPSNPIPRVGMAILSAMPSVGCGFDTQMSWVTSSVGDQANSFLLSSNSVELIIAE